MAKIPIILEPGRADGKLVASDSIFDKNKNKFQNKINQEVEERLNDVKDTLNSDSTTTPLSAKQGKVLKELLDSKVIETGSIPIDSEPILGNTTHIVNSDGLAKEFNKHNTEIILGGVYDISSHNNNVVFESLSALLSSSNLDTLIPTSVRHGGMSIRFVQSSDNKYVQYFLKKDEWSVGDGDWEKMNLEDNFNQLERVLDIELFPDIVNCTIENDDFTNDGFYVNKNGTLTSARFWKTTSFIQIASGTQITAKLSNGANNGVIAFYSDDNEESFVTYWNGNTDNEISSIVPVNANYFRACTGKDQFAIDNPFVNFKQNGSLKDSSRIRNVEDNIRDIETVLNIAEDVSSIEKIIGETDFTISESYVNTDGTLTYGALWKTTPFIYVKGGTSITAKLTNGVGKAVISFYSNDNEESFISHWNGNIGNEVSGTVPDMANYFRASTGKDSLAVNGVFVKYAVPFLGSEVIEKIKADLSSIQEEIEGMDTHFPYNTEKSWCSIGDSITWLNDNIGSRPLTKGYQDVVREKLTFTNFYNCGLSGFTAISYSADSTLDRLKVADFYTIFLGINDWANLNLSQVGTIEDYKNFTTGTANNYAQAIKKIVTKCKTLNTNSIIILFTPRRGKNFNGYLPNSSLSPNDAGIYLHEFADIIRQISEYEGFVLIDLYYHSGVNDVNLSAFSYDDALHPNDAGMRIIGQMLYDKMKDFVL